MVSFSITYSTGTHYNFIHDSETSLAMRLKLMFNLALLKMLSRCSVRGEIGVLKLLRSGGKGQAQEEAV